MIKNQRVTSVEIAEVTGNTHSDVLKAIRKKEPAWEKVTEEIFPSVLTKTLLDVHCPVTR